MFKKWILFVKRLSSLALVMVMVLVSAFGSFALTPLNQEGAQGYPINSPMETDAEIDALDQQLAAVSGGAVLSQDRASGDYACEVDAGGTGSYSQFVLADAAAFDPDKFGEIELSVKPKAGAEWIRFYVSNNGVDELIKSDTDQDGVFMVGSDLESGVWNTVRLKLIDADTAITVAGDLTVQTDINSKWGFDAIKALPTAIYSFDLNQFDVSNTEISNGKLQFTSSVTGKFNAVDTALFSGLKILEFKDDSETEFGNAPGQYSNTELVGKVMIGVDSTPNPGTAVISYGGTSPSNAFDGDIDSYYISKSTNTNVKSDYIGYNFGTGKQLKTVRIRQSWDNNRTVSGMNLQYYNGTSWVTAQTLTSNIEKRGNLEAFNITSTASSSQWRLQPTVTTPDLGYWHVCEVQFVTSDSVPIYNSLEKELGPLGKISKVLCTWEESEANGLKMELSIAPNGSDWSAWQDVQNGQIADQFSGMELNGGKIKYRATFNKDCCLKSATLRVEGDPIENELPDGKIEGIKIDRKFYDSTGQAVAAFNRTYQLLAAKPGSFKVSGDGNIVIYNDGTDNKLYSLDVRTGVSTLIHNYAASGRTVYGVNNDGTYALYTNNSTNGLVYDAKRSAPVYDFPASFTSLCMNLSGKVYVVNSGILSSWSPYSFTSYMDQCNGLENISASNADDILSAYSTTAPTARAYKKGSLDWVDGPDYYTAPVIYQDPDGDNIKTAMASPDGKSIVFSVDKDAINEIVYYRYDTSVKLLRKIKVDSAPVQISGCRVYGWSGYYDLNTDKNVSFGLPDNDVISAAYSSDGNIMIYSTSGALKKYYTSAPSAPDRYLLSFDGKNTWHTCKNGVWSVAKTGMAPTAAEIKASGMTLEEINNLGKEDFAKLYADGKEIYTLDVAIYYASVDASVTPAISSIDVSMGGNDAYETGESFNAIYASKSKSFNSDEMRSISKIYPVEITPKAAEIYYFALVDGEYLSMQGDAWTSVGTIPEAADDNWIEITQKGVRGSTLRSIGKDVLTNNLIESNSGNSFSIVYCIKAYDGSTETYRSDIYIDSTKDLFDSANLTLKILYTDGTLATYTGLTGEDVEDFMAWILARQYNKGPIFYQITTGSNHDFINYYMIQKTNVIEN